MVVSILILTKPTSSVSAPLYNMCSDSTFIRVTMFSDSKKFDPDLQEIDQDFTLDMFSEVLGVPVGTDIYIYMKTFVSENCLKIMTYIVKHGSLTDGLSLPEPEVFHEHTDTIHTGPLS